jgi:type II secretory pathway component PulF
MPTFSYISIDASGHTRRGHSEATSEPALEFRLKKAGQWLVEADEVRVLVRARRAGNRPVPRRALIEFFFQLGMQLRSGITIISALDFGARQCAHPVLRIIQQDLLDQVGAGRPLSEAMAAHPRTFAPLTVNLVRAAEASGQLSETCYQIRDYYEWLDRLLSDIRRALIYPAFVLTAALAFVILIFGFVVPRFAALLNELKVPLPAATLMIMQVSELLTRHGVALLAGTGATVAGWLFLPRWVPGLRLWQDRLKLSLPLFGDLVRLICVARFARNFAVVFRAGVTLLETLDLIRRVAGNQVLERAVVDIQTSAEQGRKLHEAMSRHSVFSPLVVHLVEVGENSGTLAEALTNVAEYHQELLGREVKKRLAILEPVLMVVLIGLVGVVAVALVLPLAKLMSPQ